MQLQQQMRPLNQANLGLAHSQGLMQGQSQVQLQQQLSHPHQAQQQQQFNQRFTHPGQSFDPSVQTAMFASQGQMSQMQPQQQQTQQQQQQQFPLQGNQISTGASQMFHNQGVFQPQSQQTGQQMQLNQSFGRGMRQQNPMMNTTHQTQGQYSTMFQGSGTGIGNKQRPTSLDLNTATPRFGQQMGSQPFASQLQTQQSSQLQAPGQQQSTGMLGSLFASGKKILEEATTPLGARGPFAHPNQPHQPMMGHLPHQQAQPQVQQQMSQMQQQQPTLNQFGQPQAFNPMVAGQANPQGGNILNTMKNIFKL